MIASPTQGTPMTSRILVADDDPATRRFIQVSLQLEGFDVVTAADARQALARSSADPPDLVLLDLCLPELDGAEVCRRIRLDPRTCHVPVIIVSGRRDTGDAVRGLAAGADDYVLTPLDPAELAARVRSTLRRTAELRAASPLTGLPGTAFIARELGRRVAAGSPFALVYADVNHFKSFNDRYGFLRGDEVLVLVAELLSSAVARWCAVGAFVGHVGGDDFLALCRPEEVRAVCEDVVRRFDERVPALYDLADRVRGHLVLPDRRGVPQVFPTLSIAMGVATSQRRCFADHREVVAVATEMKAYQKRRAGSGYAVDGRTTDVLTVPAPYAAQTPQAAHAAHAAHAAPR